MKWFKRKKDISADLIEEIPSTNIEDVYHYDKHIHYGILHIEKKIEEFMDEEVEVSQYLNEITTTYSEMHRINEMIEHINTNFIAFNNSATQIHDVMGRSETAVKEADDKMGLLATQIQTSCDQLDTINQAFHVLESDFLIFKGCLIT